MKLVKSKNNQLPYLNKSLKNLKGEQWKLIPDFGDSYMISSFGRVKSLARIIYCKNGISRPQGERILSIGMIPSSNFHVGDFTYILNTTLWWKGSKKTFSIRRLVYHCFIEPIDLEDYSFSILCKDNNGLNLHYKNLVKATRTEQQTRIYEQERSVSCFSYLDMKSIVQKSVSQRMRQITQYNLKGKKIAIFTSIKSAAEATGILEASISGALRKKTLRAGQFIWRYGNGPVKIELDGYWGKGRKEAAAKRQIQVSQYDIQGMLIAYYDSITMASKETGVCLSSIAKCARGLLHSTHGFIFRTGNGRKKISVKNLMSRERFFAMNCKKIAQYSLDGKYVTTYDSITLAARTIGVDPSSISAAARGIYSKSGGYLWKFTRKAVN